MTHDVTVGIVAYYAAFTLGLLVVAGLVLSGLVVLS